MRKPHYAWTILAIAILSVTAALGFGRFGYTIILPAMREALGLDEAGAGSLASANLLGYLLGSLASGLVSGRIRRRLLLGASLGGVAASMALTGLAPSYGTALLGRFLAGTFGAGANISAMGSLSSWFAARKRGLATGLAVGGSSIGLLVSGSLLPPLLAGGGGWRAAWLALAGGAAVIALVAALLTRDKPSDLGLQPFGTDAGAEPEPMASRNAPAVGAGGAVATRGRPLPLLLLADPAFRVLAGLYFLFGLSYIVFSTFFARFLVAERGFSLEAAGALWAGIGGCSFIGGLAWGLFSDRFGRRPAFVLGMAALALSSLALGAIPGLAGVAAASVLFALSAWSVVGVMAAAVGDAMGELAPQAFGYVTLCFGIGQALGPLLAGYLADRTGSLAPAFIGAACVAFLGSALSALVKEGRRTAKRGAKAEPSAGR